MEIITKSNLRGWFLVNIKNQSMVSDAFHLGKCSGTPSKKHEPQPSTFNV